MTPNERRARILQLAGSISEKGCSQPFEQGQAEELARLILERDELIAEALDILDAARDLELLTSGGLRLMQVVRNSARDLVPRLREWIEPSR